MKKLVEEFPKKTFTFFYTQKMFDYSARYKCMSIMKCIIYSFDLKLLNKFIITNIIQTVKLRIREIPVWILIFFLQHNQRYFSRTSLITEVVFVGMDFFFYVTYMQLGQVACETTINIILEIN